MPRTVVHVDNLPRLRILTLNLNCAQLGLPERLAAAAADITAANPDVVCLQEVLHPVAGPDTATRLAELCGMPVVASVVHDRHTRGFINGVAILSSLPAGTVRTLELADAEQYTRRVVAVDLIASSGRPIVVITAHLAWGGHRAPARAAEAHAIDRWCSGFCDESTLTVLTGDFNATPDTSAVRFLTGKEGLGTSGTYWVDVWEVRGTGHGITSTPDNPWVTTTARLVDITQPWMIPARRIDYILVRGWAHGRPGSPLTASLTCDAPNGPSHVFASDHFAVVADLWDPPLEA